MATPIMMMASKYSYALLCVYFMDFILHSIISYQLLLQLPDNFNRNSKQFEYADATLNDFGVQDADTLVSLPITVIIMKNY
jgi:hypothetical protein